MICRSTQKGWVFITQPAHAWASGQLAAAWDSPDLFRPVLREEVVIATGLHDIGWAAWDLAPPLHADGRPVNFTETELEETKFIWERAVELASLYNLYSALLVSLHAATIYRQRLERNADPIEQAEMVKGLLDQHIQTQEEIILKLSGHPVYRVAVEPAQLQANYRILRICDLLVLAMCTGLSEFSSGEIFEVPAPDGSPTQTIRYELAEDGRFLLIDPYPFSRPEFILNIYQRQIDQQTFSDQQAYHTALQHAELEQIDFHLIPN